jgi:uncharacterized membrane protein YdfJ with MMPL/SSD domain
MSLKDVAARAGRWSVRQRRRAVVGWLVFVVLAVGAGSAIGLQTLGLTEKGTGESGRADRVLNDAGFSQPARERVLVSSDRLQAAERGFEEAVADVTRRLEREEVVVNLREPVTSADQRSALIEFDVRGSIDDAADAVAPAQSAVAAAARAHPKLHFGQSGDASLAKAGTDQVNKDFKKAELSAVPLSLAILAIAFGALVAAIVPVLLGLSAVMAAIGLLAIPSTIVAMEESVNSIVLLIGLAVGVDYALFYLRREREERAAGNDERASIEAAAATSGHAVLLSGFTVMIAVAAMFAFDSVWYRSYAAGIVMVVAIAMVGSVTVLPALLSWLGDRVEKGRIPGLRRRERGPRPARGWSWVLERVLRRPLVSAIAAGAVLVTLAVPVTGIHLAEQGLAGLPSSLAEVETGKRIQSAFPGGALPAVAVVSGGQVERSTLDRLEAAIAAHPRLGGEFAADVNRAGDVARIAVPLPGSGTDDRSEAALAALREEVLPATVGADGLQHAVTGVTAASVDLREQTTGQGPWVIGLVLALSFAFLTVAFRSVVVAAKAVALNLLSVGAAFGVLVIVFQHGVGDSLLGFEASGSISTWVPVLIFLLLFGLSMDYHVFILSRIREGVDRGLSTSRAVHEGIEGTAGVVTSAAAVMVGVFSIFATLSMVEIKQIGVGLAVAVLLDATIVRGVLLPATMTLLGERNWWLPGFLARRLGAAGPAPAPGAVPAPAPAQA